MITILDIRSILKDYSPRLASIQPDRHAAVALVLSEAAQGPEVLFIQRASHDKDPWSGDLGFPGGKVESSDPSPRHTAERETSEELNLSLQNADYLGRLDDLQGAHLPIVVSCFVYHYTGMPPTLRLNHEVQDAFWFSLHNLLDPMRHHESAVYFGNQSLIRPALHILEAEYPVLWGITYRLIHQFLTLLNFPLAPPTPYRN